jgi:hypothetical protein
MKHKRMAALACQGVWALALLWLGCAPMQAHADAQAEAAFNGFEGSTVRFASVEVGAC